MNVCINCWKIEKVCKCAIKNFVEIDDDIVDIITSLNKKGYATEFCCSGHAKNELIHIYISFSGETEFKKPPIGFKISHRNGRVIIEYTNRKPQLRIESKQLLINQKINNLKAWTKNLESR